MQRSECLFTEHSASCMYCPLYLYMRLFSCLITGRKEPAPNAQAKGLPEDPGRVLFIFICFLSAPLQQNRMSLSPTSSVFASAAASASFYGKYDDQDHSD